MSRVFTTFAEQDPEAKILLAALGSLKDDVEGYRSKMRKLGEHLADSMLPLLHDGKQKTSVSSAQWKMRISWRED